MQEEEESCEREALKKQWTVMETVKNDAECINELGHYMKHLIIFRTLLGISENI